MGTSERKTLEKIVTQCIASSQLFGVFHPEVQVLASANSEYTRISARDPRSIYFLRSFIAEAVVGS